MVTNNPLRSHFREGNGILGGWVGQILMKIDPKVLKVTSIFFFFFGGGGGLKPSIKIPFAEFEMSVIFFDATHQIQPAHQIQESAGCFGGLIGLN